MMRLEITKEKVTNSLELLGFRPKNISLWIDLTEELFSYYKYSEQICTFLGKCEFYNNIISKVISSYNTISHYKMTSYKNFNKKDSFMVKFIEFYMQNNIDIILDAFDFIHPNNWYHEKTSNVNVLRYIEAHIINQLFCIVCIIYLSEKTERHVKKAFNFTISNYLTNKYYRKRQNPIKYHKVITEYMISYLDPFFSKNIDQINEFANDNDIKVYFNRCLAGKEKLSSNLFLFPQDSFTHWAPLVVFLARDDIINELSSVDIEDKINDKALEIIHLNDSDLVDTEQSSKKIVLNI
ncbi:hypothetical protein QJ850_gp412 [Acanthamoeba polyphaga mimivirus]|uniref:Uncharacterized protein n=1 Tax=Acanthamoeba polyphaga mimivirus Kroon TaxID=3069720 RepID=A0A0G2Y8W5_9VIRU|nr:hypothetical protein QJ850_gp412 [Acanthamoeba polyphaga mimivirus]AKI80287.1 hypothetical protein [Acanthamoeba polyphaga mimivirus Kroon]